MIDHSLGGVRSKQILSVLREHGPLPTAVISQILYPPMHLRRCREALLNLRRKRLVRRLYSNFPAGSAGLYALCTTERELRQVAKILDVSPDELTVCHVPGGELQHGAQCALWAEHLKKLFPSAFVVRDWEISRFHEIAETMVSRGENRDLLPDIVFSIRASHAASPVLIAVEIERTRKSSARLMKKVNSLVYDTQFDGVLYVCGDFSIGEALREAFAHGNFARSRRIGRYASDFILFTSFDALAGKLGPRYVNALLQRRDLEAWIAEMQRKPVRNRAHEDFSQPA